MEHLARIIIWNPHSVMFEVGLVRDALHHGPGARVQSGFLERLGWKRPLASQVRHDARSSSSGVLLSTLHQSSLGSLYLIVPHKLHPLWYTPSCCR